MSDFEDFRRRPAHFARQSLVAHFQYPCSDAREPVRTCMRLDPTHGSSSMLARAVGGCDDGSSKNATHQSNFQRDHRAAYARFGRGCYSDMEQFAPRGAKSFVSEAVTSEGESIRSQLAVFLHDKHPRTSDPLGKPREMMEPDSLGGLGRFSSIALNKQTKLGDTPIYA
jgi:hypothetical protein